MRAFVRPGAPSLMSVSELFSRDQKLVVPKWQRDYSWQADEQVQALLDDLSEFSGSEDLSYLLGSIITFPNSDGTRSIVDGQQRTVSLFLLILALRDVFYLRQRERSMDLGTGTASGHSTLSRLENLITKKMKGSGVHLQIPIHMEYGGGDEVLNAFAFGLPKPEGNLTNTQINISAGYSKCLTYLSEKFQDLDSLENFILTVLDGTFLVESNVGDHKQALDIFFKMNVRGLDLEGADYLKNYLFQKLESEDYDLLSEKWSAMSKNLRSSEGVNKKIKSPEFFLRNWAIVKRGEKMNGEKAVFDFWQGELKSNLAVKQFMVDIEKQASIYASIANYRLIGNKSKNPDMQAAEFLKGTQFIPALMAGSHLDEYQYFSGLIGYRYLLYVLSSEPTSRFESLIPRWAKTISKFDASASPERIEKALSLVEDFRLDDEKIAELKVKLAALDGVADNRKVRLVLALLSEAWDDGQVEFSEYLKKFTLKKRLGFETDMILGFEELKSRGLENNNPELKKYKVLGNFTLVNGPVAHYANKSPMGKAALYSNDKNVLTLGLSGMPCPPIYDYDLEQLRDRYRYSLDDWDLKVIENRGATMVNEFLSTFPDCMMP